MPLNFDFGKALQGGVDAAWPQRAERRLRQQEQKTAQKSRDLNDTLTRIQMAGGLNSPTGQHIARTELAKDPELQKFIQSRGKSALGGAALGGIPPAREGYELEGYSTGAEGGLSTARFGAKEETPHLDRLADIEQNIVAADDLDNEGLKEAYIAKRRQNPEWQAIQVRSLRSGTMLKNYFADAEQNVPNEDKWFDNTYDYHEAVRYLVAEFGDFIPKETLIAELNKYWDNELRKQTKGGRKKFGPRPDSKQEAGAKGKATEDSVGKGIKDMTDDELRAIIGQ